MNGLLIIIMIDSSKCVRQLLMGYHDYRLGYHDHSMRHVTRQPYLGHMCQKVGHTEEG